MAWVNSPLNTSTDTRYQPNENGPATFASGPFYVQYSAVTVGGTSTKTSLLSGSAVDLSYNQGGATPAQSLGLFGPGLIAESPYGSFPVGTCFGIEMWGQIKNNSSTPTFLLEVVFRNPRTGAISATPVSTAGTMVSTATAAPFRTFGRFTVTAAGVSGQITGGFVTQYGLNTTVSQMGAVPAAVTVDLTQFYYMDIMQTWGTGHANNTVTVNGCVISLIG